MINFNVLSTFEDWLPAIGVLVGTFIVTHLTRALLANLHKTKKWQFLKDLAASISNILYIIGLKLFTEIAPLKPKIEAWFDHVIYVLSIIIFLDLVQRAALLGLEWSTRRAEKSETFQFGFLPLIKNIITLFIFFSGGIMILKHFNYDVLSLVTALGVSSLAVGLAAKDTLSNMISGFILIIDKNLRPGDRVNLGGTIGDVGEIGLRSTKIKVSDGNTLIVPNSELVNTKILNLSIPSRASVCSTAIRVPYSVPFSQIKEICMSTGSQIQKISVEKPVSVTLAQLSDGHQLIQIGFWVNDLNDVGSTTSEFNELLLARLQSENIPLTAPAKLL